MSSSRTVAALSVGGGSVSVGIAEICGDGSSLLASERGELPLEERDTGQQVAALKQRLVEAGKAALAQFQRAKKGARIDDVYCVIRAPWTSTATARAEEAFPAEQRVADAQVASLARKTLAEAPERSRFLDASVSRVLLNGYPTEEPEGKRARRIEIVSILSSCDPGMRDALQQSLDALFPSHKPNLRSGTRAIVEAVAFARPTLEECLILDVSQEGIAAVVMRGGAVALESYLPQGMRAMLERADPNANPESTFSALRLIMRDECSDDACLRIEAGFARMEPEFVQKFGEFFAKLTVGKRLPNHVVLLAHPDLAPWLVRFLTRIDFTQFTETMQPLAPSALSPAELFHAQPQVSVDIDLAVALALINKEARGA